MAGYFRKAEEWNYEGAFKAGAALTNGLFVYIDGENGVKPIAEAGDAEFRVDEKTVLFGLPAVVLTCVKTGDKVHYIVENEFEDYGDKEFNTAAYSVPADHYVKMRRPNINDQIVISVAEAVLTGLNVGDIVKPASGGSIAKKA